MNYLCSCGNKLKYRSNVAAPGYGQNWECTACGKVYLKIGSSMYDYADIEPEEFIMTEGDVI